MKTVVILAMMAVASIGQANLTCVAKKGKRQPGVKLADGTVSYSFVDEDIQLENAVTYSDNHMIQIQSVGESKVGITVRRYIGGNYTEGASLASALPTSLAVDIEGGYIWISCK